VKLLFESNYHEKQNKYENLNQLEHENHLNKYSNEVIEIKDEESIF
jgi:hypothetical protein